MGAVTNIKLLLEYDGTSYQGWQRLPGTDRTIQGKLEQVASRMVAETVEIIGAGRTDAGVHALGQVANFRTRTNLDPADVVEYFNRYLPGDIVVKEAEKVGERFHSRYHAKTKTYLYRIRTDPLPSAFTRRYVYHHGRPLDLKAMREGAAHLVGRHDFRAFSSARGKKSTVRDIYRFDLLEAQDGEIHLLVEGDGFLHHMVRILAGTLVEIGEKRRDPADIPELLRRGRRREAGFTAPPQGLFLVRVSY